MNHKTLEAMKNYDWNEWDIEMKRLFEEREKLLEAAKVVAEYDTLRLPSNGPLREAIRYVEGE